MPVSHPCSQNVESRIMQFSKMGWPGRCTVGLGRDIFLVDFDS